MAALDASGHEVTPWLSLLYDAFEEGWLTLFSFDRVSGERHVDWSTVLDYERLAEAAAEREPTCCVWFGVATRTRRLSGNQRGGADACLALPGLWLDVDVAGPNHRTEGELPPDKGAARAFVDDLGVAPTVVVDSGGGLQAWWLFAEPLEVDERAERLLARWGATWAALAAKRGWHLDNVFDVARVMRLPGTTNRKAEPVRVCVVEQAGHRFGCDDLDQWLIDPPEPLSGAVSDRVPYIGPARPGDAYNATRGAGEVLGQAGFTLARVDRNGDQHWTRPGKEVREGTSATIYAEDGHCTIWSSEVTRLWPTLEVRRPYDAFGLYAHLVHGGDFRAASDVLERAGYGTKAHPDDDVASLIGRPAEVGAATEEVVPYGPQPIDWPAFWRREHVGEDWLVRPILPRGRQVALWARHKTGKSLLTLEIAAALATGQACLSQPAAEPMSVIYMDFEMTEDDLHERLLDMGYGPDDDLSLLHYYLLPSLPPLDTPAGGAAVVNLVAYHGAQALVLDTMARVVAGDENDADTYRAFYRNTGMELKTRNVSVLRLDHGGKDPTKGQRGSSGKGDDVDVVWQLRPAKDGLELARDVSRMSWVPEAVSLLRQSDPLRHSVVGSLWPERAVEIGSELLRLGMTEEMTLRAATELYRASGLTAKTDPLREGWRYAREMASRAVDDVVGGEE